MEVSKEHAELLMVEGLLKEIDQYKTAHNKLTAGLKEAVAESIKYKRERDSLIKDLEQQRELLKDFSRFIHRKVEACPGKKEYMDFRDRLNELGIGSLSDYDV